MESTRRLSLTLLLVAPIITARRLSSDDLGLRGKPETWSGLPERETEPAGDWSSSVEQRETFEPEVGDEGGYSDVESWLRRKRALDSPEDDLETAEQVLFRPTFRYKHLVKEREKHHRLQQELRRQFTQKSPVSASSKPSAVTSLPPRPPSVQRNYYNSYPQQSQRVYSSQRPTVQRLYTPQGPTAQRVYTPQAPTAQRVYSQQVSSAQRVYSPNPQRIVPKYSRITQAYSQYPSALQYTQNKEGFRPQRSSYAYLYPYRQN